MVSVRLPKFEFILFGDAFTHPGQLLPAAVVMVAPVTEKSDALISEHLTFLDVNTFIELIGPHVFKGTKAVTVG